MQDAGQLRNVAGRKVTGGEHVGYERQGLMSYFSRRSFEGGVKIESSLGCIAIHLLRQRTPAPGRFGLVSQDVIVPRMPSFEFECVSERARNKSYFSAQ